MIDAIGVSKEYRRGPSAVGALLDVSFSAHAGEYVVVNGASGCGKSTLLMALGGMLRPTRGAVTVNGTDVYAATTSERAAFRAGNIGFVFQMFHLVPYLSVLDNVLLASRGAHRERAAALVDSVGLTDRQTHRPAELSAGERQRAAIARALVNEPPVILADEPTGSLDPENETAVLDILASYHSAGGTLVLVTHGSAALTYCDRHVRMASGRIESEETP
ncbi:ABC transporter ATP-binding protein [Candidatus Poribacteria bacterium]|jgi:putative ABC transport system ATP-binding protein|nr:ABC transporter ATP-binding protein [Candidatus Poribacteria bacterium]MBT5536061.1 ABC transporter ATP-binding protein [Candidatus Poribacteria bacterium]MBT5711706.1 ABC transporter ATP-binding protein [Candidatus Poribacteria bacterium]MBT7099833.1 ABC transporter ATP-binding protein [Candidatus Poribacteria bacterium]MBT7806346.1 ABC transporter ATP-binding protein [Candidatus Poribacteria bacterium]